MVWGEMILTKSKDSALNASKYQYGAFCYRVITQVNHKNERMIRITMTIIMIHD